MQKKLLAVAVASALAVPGLALAQSSVTISGYIKAGVDNVRYSGATAVPAGGTTRAQSSENRVTDHSSRILFNITEDLGGGLQAIGQMDTRFNTADIPQPSSQGYAGAVGGGNTWVGLRSKSWGTLTFGKHDLHYGKAGDDTAAKAGSLLMISSSIFDVVGGPNASTATNVVSTTGRGMAGQTRTNNSVRWDSPQLGIFSATVAFSTNPLQAGGGGSNVEGDLHLSNGTAVAGAANTGIAGTGGQFGQMVRRKGNGWNLNPKLTGSNWFVEWSHWRAKQDTNNSSSLTFSGTAGTVAVTAVQHDQRSDVLAGNMRFGGFKIGLAWNRGRTTDPASGLVSGDRTGWAVPLSYTWGRHSVAGHWTKVRASENVTIGGAAGTAGNVTVSGSGTGAQMWAIAYDYSMSKRTSIGLSYAQLRNQANANYSLFYNSQTAFGSAGTASLAGEDSRLVAATLRHNF